MECLYIRTSVIDLRGLDVTKRYGENGEYARILEYLLKRGIDSTYGGTQRPIGVIIAVQVENQKEEKL